MDFGLRSSAKLGDAPTSDGRADTKGDSQRLLVTSCDIRSVHQPEAGRIADSLLITTDTPISSSSISIASSIVYLLVHALAEVFWRLSLGQNYFGASPL